MKNLLAVASWALILSLSQVPSAASAAGLEGRWQAFARERGGKRQQLPPGAVWVAEFQKGGKLVHSKGRSDRVRVVEGTWKLEGGKLITSIAGQTKTNLFKLEGDRLAIWPTDRPDLRMYLVRLR